MKKEDVSQYGPGFNAEDVTIDQMAQVLIIAEYGAELIKKYTPSLSNQKPLKLTDIEKMVTAHGDLSCCKITVLVEYPLYGAVYTYGNHGQYWEETGKLKGYA